MRNLLDAYRRLGNVLLDPVGTIAAVLRRPQPVAGAVALGAAVVALGVAMLPKQLGLLDLVLAPTGDALTDVGNAMLQRGLTRLIVVDRIAPPPALFLAGVLLGVAAEPVLALSRERRVAIWAVVVLGLAPVAIDRLGELVVAYLTPASASLPPGAIVTLPRRFATGPLLAWRGPEPPPGWLVLLDAHVNLVVAWTVALWSIGLRRLDGTSRWAIWHVGLPVACVAGAALVSWAAGPLLVSLVLGRP